MKMLKKLLPASVAASVLAAGLVAVPAHADLVANAAVSNMYLWRGLDLGHGTPAVSADLTYSYEGAHVGTWVSSGDTGWGNEYDAIVGYGMTSGDFMFDISAINYIYQSPDVDLEAGDLSDLALAVGYGPVKFTYYDNIAGNAGYSYFTLDFGMDKFFATFGSHLYSDDTGYEFSHLNVGYKYNDNLSFMLSSVVDQDGDKEDVNADGEPTYIATEPKMVVTYTVPLK